jgi:hypothetical protein
MSNAPLSARLFRFLAVVASAPFIVLMLGSGSHADTTTVSESPAFSSKSLPNHFAPQRRVAQSDDECLQCVQTYYNPNCTPAPIVILGQTSGVVNCGGQAIGECINHGQCAPTVNCAVRYLTAFLWCPLTRQRPEFAKTAVFPLSKNLAYFARATRMGVLNLRSGEDVAVYAIGRHHKHLVGRGFFGPAGFKPRLLDARLHVDDNHLRRSTPFCEDKDRENVHYNPASGISEWLVEMGKFSSIGYASRQW